MDGQLSDAGSESGVLDEIAQSEEAAEETEAPVRPKRRLVRRVLKWVGRLFIGMVLVLLVFWNASLQVQLNEIDGIDGSASLYREPVDLSGFINEVSESIVGISCGEKWGSGFAYDLSGLEAGYETFVVTNHHVIEECTDGAGELSVTYGGSEMKKTKSALYSWDEENDLALIQIDARLPVLVDAEDYASQGWWTMAIGNPATDDGVLFNATTFGNIVGLEDARYNYTSAVINPGNSGGPLVNSRGELIGINSFSWASTEKGISNIAVDAIVLCERVRECEG